MGGIGKKLIAALLLFAAFTAVLPGARVNAAAFASISNERPETIASDDERGRVAIDQVLRDLANPFTVMSVAARPTDIDEATLAYCRKKLGSRVVILLVTRGEGTESPSRPELDQELGVVRTRETLDVARAVGADVLFLNLRDFGYSESPDAALSVWGHDEALERLVSAYRSIRPDVILTNHNTGDGDGVERAVARLTREAFDRAASASPPPTGLDPWQPRRLFQRVDWTRGRISQGIVSINLDELDRLRGASFAEIGLNAHRHLVSYAAEGDRMTPERQKSFYRIAASLPGDPARQADRLLSSVFDGLSLRERVARAVEPPRLQAGSLLDSISNAEGLIGALKERLIEKRAEGDANQLHSRYGTDFFRILQFTQTIERALALLIGLSVEVSVSDARVVAGQKLTARVTLFNRGDRAYPALFRMPASLSPGHQGLTDSEPVQAVPGFPITRERIYDVPADSTPSVPHAEYLREQDYYGIGTTLPGAQPRQPFGNPIIVLVEVGLGQVNIALTALARFDVVPAVELETIPFAIVRSWSTTRAFEFTVRMRNNLPGGVNGALWIVPLAVSDDNYEPLRIGFAHEDEEITITLKLLLPLLKPPLSPDVLLEFRRERPDQPQSPSQPFEPPAVLGSARVQVAAVDLQVDEHAQVGFVRGIDDRLSFGLTQIGVSHRELAPDDLNRTVHGNAADSSQSVESCADLSAYNAIVIDQFAYLARSELIDQGRCLFRYVRQGGNLVMLAQRPDDFRLLTPGVQFAPYPIALSTDRGPVEGPPLMPVDPAHPLMSSPNKITSKDFEHWRGGLGLNVPRQWSREYESLLETAGRQYSGTLLVARYGEGLFIYVSLSLRRQLQAMNPGAYRLLANLVSVPVSHGNR